MADDSHLTQEEWEALEPRLAAAEAHAHDEFFAMDPEGVSYATWLTSNAARAAREVAPVSKLAKSQNIAQEWRRLSFQVNPLETRNQ